MLKILRKLTSIIRLLDFRYPSNRVAVAGSFLVAGVAGVYRLIDGSSLADAATHAFLIGFAVFGAWAFARELDPDDPRSATIALVSATALLFMGTPSVGVCFGLLFAIRVVAGTVGQPPTPLDLVTFVVLAAYFARSPVGVAAGVAMGVALVLETRLPKPAPRYVAGVGVITVLAALTTAIAFARGGWEMPTLVEWAIAGVVGGGLLSLRVIEPVTENDRHQPLDRTRLVWTLRLAVGGAFATFVRVGGPAIGELGPVWAAMLAVAIGHRLRPESGELHSW